MGKNKLVIKKDSSQEPKKEGILGGSHLELTEDLQEETISEEKEKEARKRRQRIRGLFDGSVVLKDLLPQQLPFVIFLFLLAVLMIANNYIFENSSRQIGKLKEEIKVLRTQKIYLQSKYTQESRQTYLVKSLEDMGLRESLVPPIKIYYEDDK